MDEMASHKFTQVLCVLNPEHALTVEHFERIKDLTGSTYFVDMQKCISKTGKPIPSGILESFGCFNSMSACDVWHEMISWTLDNKEELKETVRIMLN